MNPLSTKELNSIPQLAQFISRNNAITIELVIQKDEILLKHFGLAVAWHNYIEDELIHILINVYNIESGLLDTTLGAKIKMLKELDGKSPLLKKLESINRDRKILAHSGFAIYQKQITLKSNNTYNKISIKILKKMIINSKKMSIEFLKIMADGNQRFINAFNKIDCNVI